MVLGKSFSVRVSLTAVLLEFLTWEAGGHPDAGVTHRCVHSHTPAADTHSRGLTLVIWVVVKRLYNHIDDKLFPLDQLAGSRTTPPVTHLP